MTTKSHETRSDTESDVTSSDEPVRDHHGSLRSKLVLSLGAMFFVFLTLDEMVRQQVIKPEFAALEQAGAIRDANRVMAAMHAKVDHLADLAKHWAGRFDDRELGTSLPYQNSERRNTDSLEWVAIVSADGDWQWLHQRDESSNVPLESGRFDSISKRCCTSSQPIVSGMARVADNSLVMYAAVAVEPVGDQTSSHLVVGTAIDHAMVESLRKQTQVDFSLQSMRTQDPKEKLTVWEASESILVVEIQLSGIDNEQLANIYVQVPRDITAHSSQTNSMARNSFIFGSVGALLLLLLLLQRIVIGPLMAIREHSDRVAEQGFDTEPLVLAGNDEIGELANAFDHMMHRLGDAQTQLAEASRAAGRSQVASTVIHNVGNVLTNVNSLLDVAGERVEGLRIQPLSKLADRLRDGDSENALIEATPDYLEGLADSLDSDRDTISQLITTLHDNIRHIHDVIRDQQRHTGHDLEPTSVTLGNVINEAIGCCRARLEQDSVLVEISGRDDIDVHSDESLLLQSMINVIGNARQALRELPDSRTLSIHTTVEEDMAVIRFRDNGIGMSEETLRHVFDAHFTTRKSGSGLGLHFCANSLRQLGGSVHAQSDGLNCGSTFVFCLPLHISSVSPTQLVGAES